MTSDFNIINSAVISRAAIDSEEDVTSDSLDQGILYKKKGSTERIYKHLVLPSDSVGQVISADEDGDLVWVDNDFGSGAGLWLQGNLDADGADLNNSAYYPGDVGSVTSGVYFPGYVSIGSEFKDGDLNRSSSSDPFNLSVDRLNVREELFAASLAFDNIQATSIDATNATIATIAVSDSLTIGGNNVLTDATDIIRYAGSTAQYGDVVYYSGILNIGISILDNSATNYITDEYYGTSSNSPFYNPGSPDGQMNLHNTYSPIISGHSPVTLSITNEPLNLGDPDTEFDPLYSIDHDNNAT
ncbi:hypothetical protein H8D85_01820 [bacterium]|nr:hypothetical protein [bacterium]